MPDRSYGWLKDKYDPKAIYHRPKAIRLLPYVNFLSWCPPVRDQGSIGCYDECTEVLTMDGWKPFSKASLEDKLATLSPSGFLEYQLPTHKFESSYSGPMVTVEKPGFNFCVTPNHNMLVKPWNESLRKIDNQTILIRADKLGWFSAVPRTALWKGDEPEYFILPRKENSVHPIEQLRIPINDWLWFLGIYIAEGCVNHCTDNGNYNIEIAASNPIKREKIKIHLLKLPWRFTELEDRFVFHNLRLWKELEPLGQALVKYVPQYVKDASSPSIKVFLDGFSTGDGSIDGKRLYTSSKKLADDLQELVLKTGKVTNIRIDKEAGRKSTIHGRDIISTSDSYLLIIKERNQSDIERKKNVRIEDYSGDVYCFEVPNHTLYVRRNGCPMWCGNSCTGHGIGGEAYTVAKSNGFEVEIYSPTWLYNGARFLEGTLAHDCGAVPEDVFKWATLNGLLYEPYWPYNPNTLDKSAPSSLRMSQAIKYPDFEAVRVDNGLNGIMSALSEGHCVAIGAPWPYLWQSGSDEILPTPGPGSLVAGGHEVFIYGYDQTKAYFDIQNSWGKDWSTGGRAKVPFEWIEWSKQNGGYDAHYIVMFDPGPHPVPPPVKKRFLCFSW
ncbi:MAG: LAGLIDADG family homing endonuclease [Dehalococcoidales bacterium]|nr:LAGLIDADG family homing endonuclease [Dehalococcoidales bacterium]